MTNNESDTSIMLSMLHIDSGINCANELEVIFHNLEENPNEFDKRTASRLVKITKVMKECFYDCYQNYEHNNFSYDDLLVKLKNQPKEEAT